MSGRYLIILLDESPGFETIVERMKVDPTLKYVRARGIAVFHSPDMPCLELSGRGFVLGSLFEKSQTAARVRGLDARSGDRAIGSLGLSLLKEYWGGYVAAIQCSTSPAVRILRDPSGALPCFWSRQAGITLLGSDLDMLMAASGTSPAIDWSALAAHLSASGLPLTRTCLEGIFELLGGNALTVTPTGSQSTMAWSPWTYVGTRRSVPPRQLAEELRETVLTCVGTWGRNFRRVLLGISGGLDSSIVAASLAVQGCEFSTFTMVTRDALGDERHYAKAIASHLGIELVERPYRQSEVDLTKSVSTHRPRPGLPAFAQTEFRTQQQLAEDLGCEAFFSGVGGDNVFCSMQSATPLIDRFEAEGPSLRLLSTIDDICKMTGASVFDVLRLARQTLPKVKGAYPWHYTVDFIDPDALGSVRDTTVHEWLSRPPGASYGKAVHVARLIAMQLDGDLFTRLASIPTVFPLFAQPIVELCLGIPTWEWCRGGQNRAVAREAFRDLLPPEIISRRSKGGPDNFACEVVERNKALLRSFLLGGILSQQGLLNDVAIDEVLRDDRQVHGRHHARLAALAEAEAWARFWIQASGADFRQQSFSGLRNAKAADRSA